MRSATSSSFARRERSFAARPRRSTRTSPPGEVELQVDTLEIVSTSTPLPFQLDEENVDETLRLRHRWLDLRRPKMQRNIGLRSTMVSAIRRTMESGGFLEIETPILFKPTPEGARDFIVPSRLQPGRFFALPQSPQILKQLLVIGGFDRYFQIARCFRDEDLRADRVQEITQLDVEMAFPDQEFLFALMERMSQTAWRDCLGVELEAPFPRLTWAEADARFGSDKPDLRFGLEIEDATEITRDSQFGVFAGAPSVRFIRVPQAFSRAELERLEEVAKEWGAKGLAYLVWDEEGEVRSPIAKFLSEEELALLPLRSGLQRSLRRRRAGHGLARARRAAAAPRPRPRADRRGGLEVGLDHRLPDVRVVGGGRALGCRPPSLHAAGAGVRGDLRRRTRRARSRMPTTSSATGRSWAAARSGSTRPSMQARVFSLLQLSPEEQRTKFGFLLDALAMGAPPHGGIAFGIDRMMMVLAQRAEPPRRDRVSEEPGGGRPDERRAVRGGGGTAAGARNSASARSRSRKRSNRPMS